MDSTYNKIEWYDENGFTENIAELDGNTGFKILNDMDKIPEVEVDSTS